MRFLFLEPYYGGSHMDFADGWVAHSRHRISLKTLQDRFWKWRMRGASLYWADRVGELGHYDGLIVTDLMSLADFKAIVGERCPPTLAYFHESQSAYPLSGASRPDLQCYFTDITTALTADRVVFNSRTHMDGFLRHTARLVTRMPDHRPHWITAAIAKKGTVLHPGCWFTGNVGREIDRSGDDLDPPLIIWNHRWEHDKSPASFFEALKAVRRCGVKFRLALLGRNYRRVPDAFKRAKAQFAAELVRFGPVKDRAEYQGWLRRGALVVSTARQENFGIAVVEAMRFGCLPLLPNRLVYPELIPPELHSVSIYATPADLVSKLCRYLRNPGQMEAPRRRLAAHAAGFAWERRIGAFDDCLKELAASRDRQSAGSLQGDSGP